MSGRSNGAGPSLVKSSRNLFVLRVIPRLISSPWGGGVSTHISSSTLQALVDGQQCLTYNNATLREKNTDDNVAQCPYKNEASVLFLAKMEMVKVVKYKSDSEAV